MLSRRRMAMALAATTLCRDSAIAAEYAGRFSLGALWSKESFTEETQGTSTNDAAVIGSQAFLEVVRIGKAEQEFVVDVRDKHELYGKVRREDLTLTEANTFGVRQLAYKSSRRDAFTWAVGRFPVPEAGVLKNDGASAGVRVGESWRLGLFAGIGAPATARDQNRVRTSDSQGGATATYQSGDLNSQASRYVATALVSGPSYFEGEDEERRLYVFNTSFLQFGPRVSLSSIVNLDVQPKAALQTLWLDGNYHAGRSEVDVSVLRWDLTQYEAKRELRDALPPSDYQEARVRAKQGFSKTAAAKVIAAYGRRGADGLARSEFAAGPLFSRLAGNRLEAFGLFGIRDNFQSKDQFLRLGSRWVGDAWDAGVEAETGSEARKDRDATWHPVILRVDGGGVFAHQILASLAFEYAKDERATLMSGLLSVGYRFGNRIFTPARHQAPRPEALE